MLLDPTKPCNGLSGHALRNANLRQHSLARAQSAPELARTIVTIRAQTLGLTRLEFARRSGISRGTLRDLELGVHTPTRRTLQRFVAFCQQCGVTAEQIEELRRLYTGPGENLEQLISRLELRAGSPSELARRVGISPATLWEYRRGNFPLPVDLLRQLCAAVGEEPNQAENLWYHRERQRFLDRGYPEPLAEFWVLCARENYTERRLLSLGLNTSTARRLRYLEVPPWEEVAPAARLLCRSEQELQELQILWTRSAQPAALVGAGEFGRGLLRLRKQQGTTRRELADLFAIGGKKPARIIKYIEEDGFYSAQAYPAGLVAVLTADAAEQARLLDLWRQRRQQFHRRHRPEMRLDLRLARELYGYTVAEMETILGYTGLEYQKIERGVSPLAETALARIVEAIHQAGRKRVERLLHHCLECRQEQEAWRVPARVTELIGLLARREGGVLPLMRLLKQAGLKGLWAGRLRAIVHGREIPPWRLLEQIGLACGVPDLTQARLDWQDRYRAQLAARGLSPLGVELRLLIAESASTLRELSPKLGFNYSVLIRDLQRLDRDDRVKWFHVERILTAVDLPRDDYRWREFHALWYTASERRPKATDSRGPRKTSSLKLE
jgi:transcriptional regulator with XRE-family HTH domain